MGFGTSAESHRWHSAAFSAASVARRLVGRLHDQVGRIVDERQGRSTLTGTNQSTRKAGEINLVLKLGKVPLLPRALELALLLANSPLEDLVIGVRDAWC